MEFQKCLVCGTEYLFRRRRCTECGSEEFRAVEETKCTVVDSVSLIATPDPFPDQYSIVLFRTESGGRGFCRSEEALESGTSVELKKDEYGPVCVRK